MTLHTVYMAKRGPKLKTPDSRFWSKVDASGDCWEWTGYKSDGYGQFRRTPNSDKSRVFAHRFAWEFLVGPIPVGLTIDHLCRNRSCVNPDHLEPVPNAVNIARGYRNRIRKPSCKRGHPTTPENTYLVNSEGRVLRLCRTCQLERARQYRERRKMRA